MICKLQVTFFAVFCKIRAISAIGIVFLIKVAILNLIWGEYSYGWKISNWLDSTNFFLIFFFELRKRTGGYHLDKFYKCYLATITTYLTVMFTGEELSNYPRLLLVTVVIVVTYIVIIGIVNHPNIYMNSEEFTESKKLTRIIVLLEFATILSCVLLGADMIYVSYMAIAVILCAALLYISEKRLEVDNEKCKSTEVQEWRYC